MASSFEVLFHVGVVHGVWWNSGWSYRKEITINHSYVSGTLTSFPVLIDVTDPDLASKAQSSGNDIAFADDYGNKFNHEIEFFNNATGRLIAWVQVPSLSSVSDTVLYMYYGNPAAANQQNVAGTWDANYVMVQHLKEPSGTLYDSTGYHNDGTPYGGVSQNVTGKVDGAASFDGVNDYINCGNGASLKNIANEITLEAWIYVPEFRSTWTQLIYKIDGAGYPSPGPISGFQFVVSDVGDLKFRVGVSGTWYGVNFVGKVSTNAWQHVVGTFSSSDSTLRTYINGGPANTQPGPTALPSTNYNLNLAAWPEFPGFGEVKLDEVRVSNQKRSDAWISTEYNNQQSPSYFYSVGAEETPQIPQYPDVSNPSPGNGAIEVSTLLSKLSFALFDYQNDSIDYYVTTAPNIGSGSGLGVPNGTYNVTVSGLQTNTTYTWQVCAIDRLGSGQWNNQTFNFKTIEKLKVISASPGTLLTLDRGSQQTFQVFYNTPADTTWYMNGVQQQFNTNLQTASWAGTFNNLGISNVTAFGSSGGATDKYEWSVQVIINFSGKVADRVRTDFKPSQPWEQGWVLDECVWKENDTYYMLYTGGSIGSRRIGFAWSTNGLNWTKYAGNPILSPIPGTWEGREVFWPSTTLKIDGVYYVYYNGIDEAGHQGSGLAIGTNITNLARYAGNPQISDTYEFSCARYNETFWVAYNGYGFVNCLTSSDGLSWTYLKKNILLPSGSGWDSSWINPAHTYILNGTVYVMLTGNNKEAGVAYCRVGDWANLTLSPHNPILSIGTGWEGGLAAGLGVNVDSDDHIVINNELNTLDCWYVGVQSLGGTGDSGCGFGRIHDVTGMNTPPSISNSSPADGATDVPHSLSSLSFNLSDSQGDLMNYTVTTSPEIGSGSGTNMTNGHYSINVTNLSYSTIYNWTVCTTDGQLWTNKTFTFTTEANPFLDPFVAGWNYRKRITIDHTKVVNDQTDFPVLISISDPDLASKAQSNGYDILFMNGTGDALKLKHEIEFYNSTNGTLVAWVRIPFLSSTSDTVLYMYYGNPSCANQQCATGVWDSSFVMVQHLEETTGIHYDSTIYHNDGTPSGVLQGVPGRIDGADSFDGVNDYIECTNSISMNPTRVTLEAWIRPNTVTDHRPIIEKYDWVLGKGGYLIRQIDDSLLFQLAQNQNDSAPSVWAYHVLQIGNWYYVVATFDGNSLKIYVNGLLLNQTSWTGNVWSGDQTLKIGTRGNDETPTSKFFSGLIDEPDVSNSARSGGWIATRYNNEYNASAFYSVGAEEMSGPPSIVISSSSASAAMNSDCMIYVNVTNIVDLYAWELQLSYNQSILNATSVSVVAGGLNEPTQIFSDLIDQANGHLWWAASTTYPAMSGICYSDHAILEMHFHTIGTGVCNLGLYGTFLLDSNNNEISYTIANGSITVQASDLTVTSINILDDGCSIYQNDTYAGGAPYYYPVEVTVFNTGTLSAGSFHVKLEVYLINGSLLESSQEIQVAGLASGAGVVVNFTSVFNPMHTGMYRLIATADSQNELPNNFRFSNVLSRDNVSVTVMGDINGDHSVNILDAVVVSLAWDATPLSPQWSVRADLDHDGTVGLLDATRLGLHWGETN